MDTVDAATRSRIMRSIRSSGTGPERRIGAALKALGIPADRNVRSLPGSPDFALRLHRVAVFVHGCFWHGCPRHYRAPRSNAGFWRKKVACNRSRDGRSARRLRALGWSVVTAWEHDDPGSVAARIARAMERRP